MPFQRLSLPLALVLLLAGCDFIERPPLADEFGAPYDLLVGARATSMGNEVTPLVSDTGDLVVVVAYAGGCNEHHFSLRSTIADGVAQLWIVHEDFDDACDAHRQEELSFTLSPNVLAQPTVELLDPDGEALALQSSEQ